MPGVGIISNPHAGINKRDPEHNTLVWYILGNRGQFEVTQSVDQLLPLCEEFKARGVDHIGVIGGDGTICLALQSIYKAYGPDALPRILVMRGGTMNVVAANLGIFGKPAFIMNDFLDIYHSKQPYSEARLTTLNVNGKFGFLFGNGASAKFLSEFYKLKKSPTQAGIFLSKVTLGGLFFGEKARTFDYITHSQAVEMEIEGVDSEQFSFSGEQKVSMTYASTLPKAPFGFHLCKRLTSLENNFGEMIAVSSTGRELVRETVKVVTGASTSDKRVHRVLFKSAKIHVEPGSIYTLDGELFEAKNGEINISIGPTFTFCSPYKIPKAV